MMVEAVFLSLIVEHESLCLKVVISENVFNLYAVCRPPNSPVVFLHKLYDSHCNNKVLLVGDFNDPDIN